eukprot:CAMPEP_0184695844 /NCGR_PEP_ID=MMETSP0313-20130426/3347_1 /TAXON_ID=2792 /ORGANISM="Porphyridium aerugineum, Strain SAG 1380-2" /LENGTH=400 /DNA_ID=CAMNT_0027154371 /DNA_START=62 /DNA_END=1264 /DNA_ORIENTATION=+
MKQSAAFLALAATVLASMACHPAHAQDLSVIDGQYDRNKSFNFISLQDKFCTDELWLNSALNTGGSSKMTASTIIFEDGDDPCSNATFNLNPSDSFSFRKNFTFSAFTGHIDIQADNGRYALLPYDQVMTCGHRNFRGSQNNSLEAVWAYLQKGSATIYDSLTGKTESYVLEQMTLMVGVMWFNEDPSIQLPQICVYSYDKPLPGEDCFPSASMVETSAGMKRMDDLEIGDSVVVGRKQLSDRSWVNDMSEIFFFTHRDKVHSAEYIQLSTKEPNLLLAISKNHLLYRADGQRVAARDVKVGDFLQMANGATAQVAKVAISRQMGLFAPHTLDGDMIVDGFKVSTYTSLMPPGLAHVLLFPVRTLYLALGKNAVQYVSWLDASIPMKWFQWIEASKKFLL